MRLALWLDLALKAALVGLLLFAVAGPDLERFEGKAMGARAATYPIAAVLVPAIWWLVRRRRRQTPYPYALDILVVLPFLIDTAGNAADLYDSVGWWDDANHFVNWGILAAAFGQLLVRLPVGRPAAAGLGVGFGAFTAIVWELLEYFAFIRDSPEARTAYTDTLGDLTLGTSGSVVATALTVTLLWRQPSGIGSEASAGTDSAPNRSWSAGCSTGTRIARSSSSDTATRPGAST